MIAWSPPAEAADRVAVVVGASPAWRPDCVARGDFRPACRDEDAALAYADDDAWRMAFALSAVLPPDDVLVFATPDDDRSWPVALSGTPDLASIEAALAAHGPVGTLTLYIASHGTLEGIHLDDRVWSLEEIRDRLTLAAGGAGFDLLLIDACLSARWRGSGAGTLLFPPVARARTGGIEATVDSLAPEDQGLQGGSFTRLVLSALLGAARDEADHTLEAQELSDFVHGYRTTIDAAFKPLVRAPQARADAPVVAVGGPARLRVGDDEGPARWLVNVLVEGREIPFAEAYTEAGGARVLELPGASWRVWRIAYSTDDGWLVRRIEGWLARRCDLILAAGDQKDVRTCGLTEIRLKPWRGAGEQDATETGVVNGLLAAWPAAVPSPPPRRSDHWYGGQRGWVFGGPAIESPWLGRDGLLAGLAVGIVDPAAAGRGHLLAEARWMSESGANQPSHGWVGTLALGTDQALVATPHFRLGVLLRVGAGVLVLSADGRSTATASPVLDLGASATLPLGSWSLRVEPAWLPRQPYVLGPASRGPEGRPDLARGGLVVAVERAW